ncbi:hypothetical protein D3C86_1778870 [compost metagenome]
MAGGDKTDPNPIKLKAGMIRFDVKCFSCRFPVPVFHEQGRCFCAVYGQVTAYGMIAMRMRDHCVLYNFFGV